MDKQIKYIISENQTTNLKVNNFSISENESLSMLYRYSFCIDDSLSIIEETPQNIEDKYHKKEKVNYLTAYRELSKYSSWELIRQLSNKLLPSSERKELYEKIAIIVAMLFVYSINIIKIFNKSGIYLSSRKNTNIFIGIICIVALIYVTFLLSAILKQVKVNMEKNIKNIIAFFQIIICVVVFIVSLNIDDILDIFIVAEALEMDTDQIDIVYASELYRGNPNIIVIGDDQIIKIDDDQIVKIDEEDYKKALKYSENFLNAVEETYKSIEFEDFCNLSYKNEDVVAEDINGKEYTLSQLSNQKLLIPYTDGEKAVLFYGQYKNNYWDDDCIFNIYEYNEDIGKNVLKIILEAKYNNGRLESYKKIAKTKNGLGVDVWSVSDRTRENDYNCGETYNYLQLNDYLQDFDIYTAGVENIIYVDNFENILKANSKLEGYYYGKTSDGYYNDDTGNAYMIKYAEDGTIRMLYRGGFKNGFSDDQTGNAWQIVFDNSNNINKYFYYKGMFKNGNRVGRVTSSNYVDQTEIKKIINGMTFNCEVKWYPTIE